MKLPTPLEHSTDYPRDEFIKHGKERPLWVRIVDAYEEQATLFSRQQAEVLTLYALKSVDAQTRLQNITLSNMGEIATMARIDAKKRNVWVDELATWESKAQRFIADSHASRAAQTFYGQVSSHLMIAASRENAPDPGDYQILDFLDENMRLSDEWVVEPAEESPYGWESPLGKNEDRFG